MDFQCKTSEVFAINLYEYIEADECMSSCGVDRKYVGISSDALLDSQYTAKMCSPQCYQNCPNIVDLYYNWALEEALGPIATVAGPMSASAPSPSSPVDCALAPM
ncbi:unnamed protein product [Fraxinus pennsylvanica]|uniref:Uncharacterized protein n=1 Tax=Fraxinus pennsylvanica TaxID=56036 RepID=A0AAD2DM92_9LAMI|nr:unnamed protein product [Fraxinus pennsylvanica]